MPGDWLEELGQRRCLRGGVDEDERSPGLDPKLEQADSLGVESRLTLRARGCAKLSVEVVRPGVVAALQGLALASPFREDGAAVTADVQECPQGLVPTADDEHRDVSDAAGEELACGRGVLDRTGVLPGAPEDPLLLSRQQLRIGVPAPRQRGLGGSGGQTGHDYTRRPMDFSPAPEQ